MIEETNNINLTKLGTIDCVDKDYCHSEIWYLLSPPTGTAYPVKVTTSNTTHILGNAISFYNVDQTTPFGTIATKAGYGSDAFTSVTTTTNQLVLDGFSGGGYHEFTPDSAQTKIWSDISYQQGASSIRTGKAGTTPMEWYASRSDDWAIIAIPIN